MLETYPIRLKKSDPYLQIQVPAEMLKELRKRSHENGRNLNFEIMIRLSRTLENDHHRDDFDRTFEKIFFLNDEEHNQEI